MDPQDPTQTATTGQTAQGGTASAVAGRLPEVISAKYPDLEPLIMATESMTDEERDYWFQILPIMTDEQVGKLRGILLHEKEQLTKLDSDYQGELAKINDKHMSQWKEEEIRAKREKLQAEELSHEAQEKAQEAALLGQLDDHPNSGASPIAG